MKDWSDYKIEVPAGRSGQVYTTCPQCSHLRKKKNVKCLSINVDERKWNCHHCGFSGDLTKGKSGTYGKDFWLDDKYILPKVKLDPPKKGVLKWFADRGIDEDEVMAGGIGSARVYMPQVEDFVNAIAFPYYRDGELINVKYRDHQKNMRLEAGAERILYGMDDCAGYKTLYWVEGEPDKHALGMVNIRNCVSVPNGAPDPKTKNYPKFFEFFQTCGDFLSQFDKHVFCLDNDIPGQLLEQELARRLGAGKCARVNWLDDCKDANDVLVKHGPDSLLSCIKKEKPYPVAGIYEVSDIDDQIDKMYTRGYDRGKKCGIGDIDYLYRVRSGEWSIWTGSPGCGKSELLDDINRKLSELYGWKHGVFSPENQPLERHFVKLAEKYIGKPFTPGYFKNAGDNRMTREELEKAKKWIGEHFFFILPDEIEGDSPTLDNILEKARTLVFRHGINTLTIDPWNEIEHSRPSGMNETDYISLSLTKIRKFARNNRVHVYIVAHPTKLPKVLNKKTGLWEYPKPDLYSISGSAHWYNKADMGVVVYREDKTQNKVEFIEEKCRFKETGSVGRTFLLYDSECGRFRGYREPEPEPEYKEPEPETPEVEDKEIFEEENAEETDEELQALAEEAEDLFK